MGLSVSNYQDADYPIVAVDEAAVSVDADNEQYVQDAISELCQGKNSAGHRPLAKTPCR